MAEVFKINILVCDDMRSEAAALESLIRDSGFQVNINKFYKAPDVLDFIRAGAVIDLCFLDIVMPDMTGIELAEALRQSGYTGEIVFLSASKEYGPESYTVGAFSYLLKATTAESVGDILNRLENARIYADRAEISVEIARRTKLIPHRYISHIEVIRRTIYFHMIDGGEALVTATFSEIATKLLSDPRFIQCHRSYVVNMQDVAEISEREIVTHSGKRIPITRTYRDTRNKFYKWKFGGGTASEL